VSNARAKFEFTALFFFTLRLGAAPTFHDVQPILREKCMSCHQPGAIAPMPLLSYSQSRPWAKAIRDVVVSRRMPPWFADPHTGPFANDPSLTEEQIATIRDWVDAGAPQGTPDSNIPIVGTPYRHYDVEISLPKPFRIPAKAVVDYQYIVLPYVFRGDRWIQAAEIRPTDRRVVHHAVLYVREKDSPWLRSRDTSPRDITSDILAIYTPGAPRMECLPSMAKKVPDGADLVLQVHYTSLDTATTDQTEVRLLYATEPPKSRVLTLQMSQYNLRIPPGARNYRASVAGTLPRDALLLSMFPHMHLRGKGFEYQVLGTRGRVDTLLRVNNYDFNWQLTYILKTPLPLKAGTQLLFTGYFDNSAANPRNPDPAEEVEWGDQSWEEMLVGFFDVAVPPDIDKPAFFVR
jgi:hypothetical protein